MASHTDQIDAVAIATVGQIVTEMGAVDRDTFAVGQDTDIVPIHFGVSKTGPSVTTTLQQEFLQAPSLGRGKEQIAGIRIVKVDFTHGRLDLVDKVGLFKVAAVFRVVAVEIANTIGRVAIAIPTKVVLDRDIGGAVCFRRLNGTMAECGV